MANSFYAVALKRVMHDLERAARNEREYTMSQIGKPIKKVVVEPETVPVPPKTVPAPTPVEQPVETPA